MSEKKHHKEKPHEEDAHSDEPQPMTVYDGVKWGFCAGVLVTALLIFNWRTILSKIRDWLPPPMTQSEPNYRP